MASTDGARGDLLGYLPPIWLGVVMALSAWGLWSSWPLLSDPELEAGIAPLFYAAAGFGLFTLVFGTWILVLFARRSPSYARNFLIWQSADIAWLVIYQLWVTALLDFAPTAEDLARVVAEIVIGAFCIAIVRRKPTSTHDAAVSLPARASGAQPAGAQSAGPSGLTQILVALVGIVLGGAVGFGLGLGLGILIAETTSMSCFEGACGFFAFFMGLGGLLLGAIAGPILGVWWVRRRR